MGNRALRRQQAKTKERAGTKAGAGSTRAALPRASTKSQSRQSTGGGGGGLRSLRPKFFMDIWAELKKVSWPVREDVMHLTVVIVIVTIMMGAVLGAIDLGFGWLIDKTLLN